MTMNKHAGETPTKGVAYELPDGTMATLWPVVCVHDPEWYTMDHAFDVMCTFDVPKDAKNLHAITPAGLPPDTTFRAAWRTNGKVIGHDLEHAKAIAKDIIRVARESAIVALDGEYVRALEGGKTADMQAVAVRKQQWRDAPADSRLQSPATILALKAALLTIAGELHPGVARVHLTSGLRPLAATG